MAPALMARSKQWIWPLVGHEYSTHLQWRGFCLARVFVPWNHLRQRNRYQANLPTR
jgi:hypothetical protein